MRSLKSASLLLIAVAAITGMGWLFWLSQQPPKEWVTADRLNTVEGYNAFLATDPRDAVLVEAARNRIHNLAWDTAKAENTVDAYRAYADAYPKSPWRILAAANADKLHLAAARAAGTREALEAFVAAGPYNRGRAQEARLFIAWLAAEETIARVDAYVRRAPREAPALSGCNIDMSKSPHDKVRWKHNGQIIALQSRLRSAARRVRKEARLLMKSVSDVRRLRAESEAWEKRLSVADTSLVLLQKAPVFLGGVSTRMPELVRLQRLANAAADPDVRSRLAGALACTVRQTADEKQLRAYLSEFADGPHASHVRAALDQLQERPLDRLIRDGVVSASHAGGRPGRLKASIVNHSDLPVRVAIPPGTIIGAGNLVVRARIVRLKPGEEKGVAGIPSVYGGLTRWKNTSSKGIAQLSENDPLYRYLPVLGTLGISARHAAAWIVGQDATYEQMWRLRIKREDALKVARGKRAIDEKAIESALKALSAAGYDVASRRICKDRRWAACGP